MQTLPWLRLTIPEINSQGHIIQDFFYGTITGYIAVTANSLYLPWIYNYVPGNGLLAHCYLALDHYAYCESLKWFKVPGVIHAKLQSFLLRREFSVVLEYSDTFQEDVEVFVHPIRFMQKPKERP